MSSEARASASSALKRYRTGSDADAATLLAGFPAGAAAGKAGFLAAAGAAVGAGFLACHTESEAFQCMNKNALTGEALTMRRAGGLATGFVGVSEREGGSFSLLAGGAAF